MRSWRLSDASLLFVSLCAFHLFRVFQGLEVNRTGVQLTDQVCVTQRESLCTTFPLTILSDFIAGLWLMLPGEPFLLWARLGGVLLAGANGLFCYFILSRHFAPRRVALVVFAVSPLITVSTPNSIIDYDIFPAFLVTVALLLFNVLLHVPVGARSSVASAFLLGVTTVALILSRPPLVVILGLPVLLWSVHRLTGRSLSMLQPAIAWLAAGMVTAILVIGVAAKSTGHLDVYLRGVAAQSGASLAGDTDAEGAGAEISVIANHSIKNLIRRYVQQAAGAFTTAGIVVAAVAAVSLIKQRVLMYFAFAVLVAAVHLVFAISPRPTNDVWVKFYIHQLALLLLGTTLILGAVFLVVDRWRTKNVSVLMLVSLYLMAIYSLGSNPGLIKAVHAMWIPLPLVLLAMWGREPRALKGWRFRIGLLCPALLVVLFGVGVLTHVGNIFNDDPNRLVLTEPFQHRSLRGLYSSRARARAMDETLIEIDSRTQPGDRIFATVPIFYFLTDTEPLLGSSFPQLLHYGTVDGFRRAHDRTIARGDRPQLVIIGKQNFRADDVWPQAESALKPGLREYPYVEYLRGVYLEQLGYVVVWENSIVELWAKPA